MSTKLSFCLTRWSAAAVIGAAVLIATGFFVMSGGEQRTDKVDAPHFAGSGVQPAPAQAARGAQAAAGGAAHGVAAVAADESASAAVKPLTARQAGDGLRALVDKILKREDLSAKEIEEFQTSLLESIENDIGVVKTVQQFYHDMPAEQGMERDMLRSLLVVTPAGRSIVLHEANAIWQGQSENKFAEMYETYFNLPGQAPQDVIVRALADVKAGTKIDERTAVARLNFIGTLAEQKSGDVANLRSDAVQLLNQTAQSQGSDLVRALAVQKLYRLNSPAEASNIAITQLSKGAYGDLVRETLSSVNSGDVELTPNLRAALTTAVKRPGASAEEKQQFSEVLGPHS
ncbi:hypothetical protein [Duganella phyllosphaerae]|uniref:Uncharacterized protein n=1 Tax=Duganella phyllosphaerae TaxID=762836 RepID=A0A1E7W4H4_9BURK|nr:hypothetical protein [Duganella phyllosphaerae]OEZ90686.1 hypothetical protein DUPY_52910 [Duganella phyllosphaerae]